MSRRVTCALVPWTVVSLAVLFVGFVGFAGFMRFIPAVTAPTLETECVNKTKYPAQEISDTTCIYHNDNGEAYQCEIVQYKPTKFTTIDQFFNLVCQRRVNLELWKGTEVLGAMIGLAIVAPISDVMPRFFGACVAGTGFVTSWTISFMVTAFEDFLAFHVLAIGSAVAFWITVFVSFAETFPALHSSIASFIIVTANYLSVRVMEQSKQSSHDWRELGLSMILLYIPFLWYFQVMIYPFNLWMTDKEEKIILPWSQSYQSYAKWWVSKYMMLLTFALTFTWAVLFYCVGNSMNFSIVMESKGVPPMNPDELISYYLMKLSGVIITTILFYREKKKLLAVLLVLMAINGFAEVYYINHDNAAMLQDFFKLEDMLLDTAAVQLIPLTIEIFPKEIRCGGLSLCIFFGLFGFKMNMSHYRTEHTKFVFTGKSLYVLIAAIIFGMSMMEIKNLEMMDKVQNMELYEYEEDESILMIEKGEEVQVESDPSEEE